MDILLGSMDSLLYVLGFGKSLSYDRYLKFICDYVIIGVTGVVRLSMECIYSIKSHSKN